MSTKVFITGATGYVGGSVVHHLLQHPILSKADFTALVRKADKAAALQTLGIKTVLGSYDDHALLEEQASMSDVIFSMADSDDAEANFALLRGLKKRYEATGKPPILIHTTGSGIVKDNATGEPSTETAWDDSDQARIDTIAATQLHRNVDNPIIDADEEGYVRTYLICPPTIYGMPSGKLVDLGVQHTSSIQIPMMVVCSVARKRAGHVGQGLNVWPHLHVDDTAGMYIVLYDAIQEGKAGHGREGLYFGENGHYKYKDVAIKIGETLHDLGLSGTSEPNSFDEEDFKRFPYLDLLGTNCKIKATRLRALGWTPKYTTEDLLKSVRGDVESYLKLTA